MPRPKGIPAYRLHKPSGRAVATFGGRDEYFGPHGTPESRRAYERHLAEWLARGRVAPPRADAGPTVTVVMAAYLAFAQAAWKPKQFKNLVYTLRPVRRLYADVPAAAFGPLALQAVQGEMVRLGWTRGVVNQRVNRVRAMFKWAVSQELVKAEVWLALRSVPGLRQGRTAAPEPEAVKDVPDELVDAVKPFVTAQVWAMIQVQRYTGMRPGEVVRMRGRDLRQEPGGWLYAPAGHKTGWRGKTRVIPLGPKAVAVLKQWLRPDPDEPLFQPREAKGAHAGKRAPGLVYAETSYAHAVMRACDKAFPPPLVLSPEGLKAWRGAHRWHPHRLRHSFNTKARERFDPEHAQAALGHATLQANELYDHSKLAKARKVMEELG